MTLTTGQWASAVCDAMGLAGSDPKRAQLITATEAWDPTTPSDLAVLVQSFVASIVYPPAESVGFDHSASGIPATNVQEAMDYVLGNAAGGLPSLTTGPLSVGLFSGLAALNIPAGSNVVMTSGFGVAGLGSARYVATTETLDPTGQGVWWQQTANGRKFKLDGSQQITPLTFGARGDGLVHDDAALLAAIHYNERVRGRGLIYLRGLTYRCTVKLTADPTRTGIMGEGGRLDFSLRGSIDPGSQANLVPDPHFNDPSGWHQGTLSNSPYSWVIGSGKATHTTPRDNLPGYYNDFSRLVPGIKPSTKYNYTVTVGSYTKFGNANGILLRVLDGEGSPPGNGAGYGGGAAIPFYGVGTFTGSFSTPASIGAGGAWVGFQTQLDCEIDFISLVEVPDNDCLLMAVAADGPAYGTAMFPLADLELVGGGGYQSVLAFETDFDNKSSRGQYRNLSIFNGYNGVRLGNRCYAMDLYGVEIFSCQNCVYVGEGTIDAGEEVGFYGCTFYNCGWCINNAGGFEINVFGGSMDYPVNGWFTGPCCTFKDTHFEGHIPDDAANRFFLQTGGGDLILDGCRILIGPGSKADYVFEGTDRFSFVFLDNCGVYGLATASGALMGGTGRIFISGQLRWGANKNVAGVPKLDATHNLLGSRGGFESGDVMAWLDDSIATGRAASISYGDLRYSTGGNAAGNGTLSNLLAPAPVVPGTWSVRMTSPTTFKVLQPNRRQDGVGVVGTPYVGGIQLTVNTGSAAFSGGDQFSVYVGSDLRGGLYYADNYDNVSPGETLRVTGDAFHTGSKSLCFTKTGLNTGNANTFNIAIPCSPRTQVSLSLFFKIAGAGGAGGQFYIQAFYGAIIGFDADGVPQLGADLTFFGELDYNLPGSGGWESWGASTNYVDGTSPSDGHGPDWCNAIILRFNPQNLPIGAKVYLDDLAAYQFGGV